MIDQLIDRLCDDNSYCLIYANLVVVSVVISASKLFDRHRVISVGLSPYICL